MEHTLQSAWEMGQEARIVQIDFSAAFDSVNHQGILSSSVLCELEVHLCLLVTGSEAAPAGSDFLWRY